MKVVQDVVKFMLASDQEVPVQPSPESNNSLLYHDLIHEEHKEWLKAWDEKDDVEKLDACCDKVWVIIGYCVARGWDFGAAWDEVAKTNHAKISSSGKVIKDPVTGKVQKPVGWVKPNMKQFVEL